MRPVTISFLPPPSPTYIESAKKGVNPSLSTLTSIEICTPSPHDFFPSATAWTLTNLNPFMIHDTKDININEMK